MEISKEEAQLIMGALDRVDVRGLETNRQVMILAAKLQNFLTAAPQVEEEDGDDVPDSSE